MNYTRRLIECESHGPQVVVLVPAFNGQLADRCVKCHRDEHAADGRCACECGALLGARQRTSKYVDQRHRQRAHREDLRALAAALGVNPSLSVKTLESLATPSSRRSDDENAARTPQRARSRPRKPQLRISYGKAVEAVAQAIEDGVFEPSQVLTPRGQAEVVLHQVLPKSVQAHIEEGLLAQWEAEAA